MKKVFLLLTLAVLFAGKVFAVSAYPYPIKFNQPDGKTSLTLTLKGDEKVSWAESQDGYTLVYDNRGFMVYATIDQSGDMVPSKYMATDISDRSAETREFLSKTPKRLRYSASQISYMRSLWDIRDKSLNTNKSIADADTLRILVIMAQFPNRTFVKTQQQIDNMFNQVNYSAENAVGSVTDFYHENSYGKLKLIADVVGPYTADYNTRHYGRSGQGTAQSGSEFAYEFMTKASNAGVDFSRYDRDHDGVVDGVHIIFAGYGRESNAGDTVIWSHKWSASGRVANHNTYAQTYSCSPELRGNSGTNISHIGVACHEIGHVLGAPDYYDTDYESNGQYPGMGMWDVMASGSWGGVNGQSGNCPPHHNAYTKAYIYGWIPVTTLSSYDTITLQPFSTDSSSVYRIDTRTSNEYYLIDNRQLIGFDQSNYGHGLMIYHVHSQVQSASWSNVVNYSHPQMFYPVCASATVATPDTSAASYGNINSDACPFPGSQHKYNFTDFTTPCAKSWAGANTGFPIRNITEDAIANTVTFICGDPASANCPVPTNLHLTAITENSATITWNQGSSSNWQVCYGKSGFDPSVNTRTRRFVNNVQTNSCTISGLDVNDTVYDIYVRTICGAGDTSIWSANLMTIVTQPDSGHAYISACGIHVYDNGGATGAYDDDKDVILTVRAATPQSVIRFTGSAAIEDYDYFIVYDGEDTTGSIIYALYSNYPTASRLYDGNIDETSTSGAITIRMLSDIYDHFEGFDLLVSCVDTTDCDMFTIPYSEDFSGYTASASTTAGGDIPRCWTTYTSNTSTTASNLGFVPHISTSSSFSPNGSSQDNYMAMVVKRGTSANRAYVILPGFNDTLSKSVISFKARQSTSSASTEMLHLGYIANYTGSKTTDTVFTPLTVISNIPTLGNDTNSLKTVNLHAYNIPDTARLAFRWMSTRTTGTSNYSCGIDDVNIISCEGKSTQYEYCCDPTYTWTLDGNTYSTDTIVSARLTGASYTGCDSIVTLDLKFRLPSAATDTVRACHSYTWIDNQTYTASTNTPTFRLTNAVGCDSIVTLNLTILNDTTIIDSVVACDSLRWIDDSLYTASTNVPTYTYTTALGCDSTINLHLTIVHPTSGIDSIVACDSITWINGITYRMSNRVARCTIQNAAGCDSVVYLRLTVKHKPTVRITADRTSLSNGESVTLTASGATSYLWSTGSTSNPITETPSQTTTYSVIGMNTNDEACKDTASIEITVTTGINEANGTSIAVYPNPAQQLITVEGEGMTSITIYNTLGQKLASIPAQNGKNAVNVADYAEGLYTLQIERSNGEKSVRTFVIRRK